jgi:hypothetical protein
MNNWREFKFKIIDNNINQTFMDVESFIKSKRIDANYFFIIKRPNIYLRIIDYNGTDFDRIYEPEYYQFGGNNSWNIIAKYLNIMAVDKLENNNIIIKNYYGYARGILNALTFACGQRELYSIINLLRLARPLFEKLSSSQVRSVYIDIPGLKQLPMSLRYEKEAIFSLDKILPFVIIFAFNIYDIPLEIQIRAIHDFSNEKEAYR